MPMLDGNGLSWLINLIKKYIGTTWSMSGDTNDILISETDDLDDYTTIGNYYCRPDTAATQVNNNPSNSSFILKVYSGSGRSHETSGGNYLIQRLEDLYGTVWTRYKSTGNWSSWSRIVMSDTSGSVGGEVNPIYISGGEPIASSSTVGSSTKPVYLSSGRITASSSTVGSGTKPIYLSSGTITASSSTVGSGTKPIYLSSGTITASSSTVGSATKPIYLSSGTITVCSQSLYSNCTNCNYNPNCNCSSDSDNGT